MAEKEHNDNPILNEQTSENIAEVVAKWTGIPAEDASK